MIPTPVPQFSSQDFEQYFHESYLNWTCQDGIARPAYVREVGGGVLVLGIYDKRGAKNRNVTVNQDAVNRSGWATFSWPSVGYTSPEEGIIVEVARNQIRTTAKAINRETASAHIINETELRVAAQSDKALAVRVEKLNLFHESVLALWYREDVTLAEGLRAMFSGKGLRLGKVISPAACLVLNLRGEDCKDYPVSLLLNGAEVRKYASPTNYKATELVPDQLVTELVGD